MPGNNSRPSHDLPDQPPKTPATATTIEYGPREAGLELSAHRARVATPEMIANHDLVLVMSASQRQAVSELAPFATGKTLLFAHWLDGIDIPDPYRKSLDAHRQVFVMLSDAADAWHRRLAP